MKIPQNTAMRDRSEGAEAAAVKYRRRVERAEMANWKRFVYIDPATGRARALNVRHT
jgi:hypothetical protein